MSRDILAPPLQRMGPNRSYRVNQVHEDFGGNPAGKNQQQFGEKSEGMYTEQDLYGEDDHEKEEGACTVEELANSVFKLTMHVAPSFYGGLIGFKGSNKRRIENETHTEIFVPRMRDAAGTASSDEIHIRGKTRSSVFAAKRQIDLLVASLRKRMRPTHFLCIPLHNSEVKEHFIEFQKQVSAANLPGVDEELFQKPNRIHLTLGVCVLLDDVERAKAVELLQSCRKYLANLEIPFDIQVNGLEIMNDDPSAVRVLYACVDAPELQKFANQVMQPFIQTGLAFEEFNGRVDVKLHMTVLNTTIRRKVHSQAANSFDAREILKRFGNFNFGSAKSNELDLCVFGGSALEECYKVTAALKL